MYSMLAAGGYTKLRYSLCSSTNCSFCRCVTLEMAYSIGIGFSGPRDKTADMRTEINDSKNVLHFGTLCLSIRAAKNLIKTKKSKGGTGSLSLDKKH